MYSNLSNKEGWSYIVTKDDIRIGNILYYARIIPQTGIYEVCDLYIRTIKDGYFVGVETKHDKHAYLFPYDVLEDHVFKDRKQAVYMVREAEKNKVNVPEPEEETYYEEY